MNLKKFGRIITYTLMGGLLLVLVLPIIYFSVFFDFPNCDEDSKSVAYARSLSSERLTKLYFDMSEFSMNNDVPPGGYIIGNTEYLLPSEFSDLNVKRIDPRLGDIVIEGCLDNYVFLTFHGLERRIDINDSREIILKWGEYPPNSGSEVLWSEGEL